MSKLFWILGFHILPAYIIAQCDVTEKMMADGTMYYHGETLLFYKTSEFQLSGSIVTDKEHYYLRLKPLPFPERPAGTKLIDNLEIKLTNDTIYTLKLHDAYYRADDTSFTLLFLFDKKDIEPFRNKEVVEIRLNLGQGSFTYEFRLHKDAIRQQLACFSTKRPKY
jgi:hypothetical protein